MFSLFIYLLKQCGIVENTTWCTEIYGFVWGIVLIYIKDKIINTCNRAWILKCTVLCLISGVLGIAYLKIKTVLIFGDYLLKIMLGIAIILFILFLNTKINIGNKMSKFIGEISFEVYLLHNMAFIFLILFYPSIQSGAFILISVFITIAVSWVVHIFSNKLIRALKLRDC